MKFVVDESVDAEIVTLLRMEKHDVLRFAVAQSAVLITADKDFRELVFRKNMVSNGVILIRVPPIRPAVYAPILLSLIALEGQELSSAFTVLTEKTTRIRRLRKP